MRRVDVHPFGWLSLLPPALAIGLAIASRRAIPALLAGIWVGWLIATGWRPLTATAAAARGVGDVLTNPGQARVVLFTILMGVLIRWMQQSGGVAGFLRWARRRPWSNSRRGARLMAATVGLGVFIESTITCLVVGTVARPFFDRHRIAREKLAYICDATSAPVCMLIPLNSWGAVVLALLAAQAELGRLGDRAPLAVFLAAVPLNFYAFLSVLLVFVVAATGYDVGPMRRAERRAREVGPPTDGTADPHPRAEAADRGSGGTRPGEDCRASYEAARDGAEGGLGEGGLEERRLREGTPRGGGVADYGRSDGRLVDYGRPDGRLVDHGRPDGRLGKGDGFAEIRRLTGDGPGRARHLAVPLALMMGTVLAGIAVTGVAGARAAGIADPTLMDWLEHASGSTAVLAAVVAALAVLGVAATASGDARPRELADAAWRGAASMLPIATVLVLALAIGGVCGTLGTGPFIADRAAPLLTPALAAPVVFVTSAVIAFATGTSFGTFAIMIPLAVPLAAAMQVDGAGVSLPLVVSAVLGGGVFGDHCSPISDTTVISSAAAGSDHIEHVRTQAPYALAAAAAAVVLYLLAGLRMAG